MVLLLVLGAIAASPSIAGADIPVDATPVCRGTTQDGTGAVTTPAVGSIVFAGAYLSHYQTGEPVSMYNNLGERAFTNAGNAAVADRVPTCALRSIGGVPVATWLYCTDETLSACNSTPTMTDEQPNPRLSATSQQEIAVLLDATSRGSQELTSRGRALIQLQVWCISESISPGSEMTAARNYFNSNNRLPPGDDITAPEAICDPLPPVPVDPTITVTAVAASVSQGVPAQYTVTSNTVGSVDLTASAGTISLCPSDVSGATLTGAVLGVATANTPVEVCVSTPTPGSQSLAGAIAYSSVDGLWSWTGGATCQYFAGARGRVDSVSASAAVTVQAAATTTTTTSTTTPTSTSTSTTTTTTAPTGATTSTTPGTAGAAAAPQRTSPTAGASPSSLAVSGRNGIVAELLLATGAAFVGLGLLRLRRLRRR